MIRTVFILLYNLIRNIIYRIRYNRATGMRSRTNFSRSFSPAFMAGRSAVLAGISNWLLVSTSRLMAMVPLTSVNVHT